MTGEHGSILQPQLNPQTSDGPVAANGSEKPNTSVPNLEDLSDFIENASVALHGVGPDGIILWANRAELDLLGYSRDEYIGHHISEFHADEPVINDILTRLIQGETLRDYEARLRGKDGLLRHVIISSNVRFEDGKFIHTRCFTRDITLRKRAEQQLEERSSLDAFAAQIGKDLIESGDLPDMLHRCTQAMVDRLDAAFARIWTLSEHGDALELQASSGLYTHINGGHARVPLGSFKVGLIGATRSPHLTNQVIGDPRVPEQEWARRVGMVAFAGYPMVVDDCLVGVIAMFSRHTLSDLTLQAIERIASQIALGIERKRVESAERLRTEQFEALLNEVPLGVYLVDADFRIRAVNPTALPAFGDIPELIGRDFDEVVHRLWPKAYADEIMGRYRHTLETGEPYFVAEKSEERRDRGKREYYEWQINRIPLPEGRYGVVCYFRDISAHVLTREAIAHSEERLRFMAESMPQKIFTANSAGEVDYFNQQWTEFTGLSFEQIKNWGWTQFIHPDDVAENVRIWKQSIESGDPFKFVHRFRRFDGAYRWHLSRAHAMRDANGNISMWIGSNTEIHEQKEIEDNLRRANEDLEQFAYSASHDLQEPIRNICIYGDILGRRYGDSFDEKGKQYLGFMTAGARRMESLIKDLLTYTQSAPTADQANKVDATTALLKALADLAEAIRESGAEVSYDPLPTLRVHEVQLQQIFQNLIGNAIKYRKDGEAPRIHVTAVRENEYWRFAVQDNGVGIPPNYAEKIFGLFKRLHTDAKYSGTGIGLAICQKIVERNNGRIWVESSGAEQGSTFFFTLPIEGGI